MVPVFFRILQLMVKCRGIQWHDVESSAVSEYFYTFPWLGGVAFSGVMQCVYQYLNVCMKFHILEEWPSGAGCEGTISVLTFVRSFVFRWSGLQGRDVSGLG